MLSPLPRCSDGRSCLAHPFRHISLPRKGRQVGLHIVGFEAYSAFTHVTACTLALSPYFVTRLTEGFNHFVTSMIAPVTSGWSILPGGACTHWEAPPLHGARHCCRWKFGRYTTAMELLPDVGWDSFGRGLVVLECLSLSANAADRQEQKNRVGGRQLTNFSTAYSRPRAESPSAVRGVGPNRDKMFLIGQPKSMSNSTLANRL